MAKTRDTPDVFNKRCLRNILVISWKGHVNNEDLLDRTKVDNLHDTVSTRGENDLLATFYVFRQHDLSLTGEQNVGKVEAHLRKHGRIRYVMIYKRWMSAARRGGWRLTARSA